MAIKPLIYTLVTCLFTGYGIEWSRVLMEEILFMNILKNFPIPSGILEYAIYSAVIIAIMEVIVFFIGKLNKTISNIVRFGIVISVLYLAWKNLSFLEAIKAAAIFVVLLVLVIIVKRSFTPKHFTPKKPAGSKAGPTYTRYVGRKNGKDVWETVINGKVINNKTQ